jgi:hypothetical protein
MTITVPSGTAAGTYQITVTATGGGITQTATVTLIVPVPTASIPSVTVSESGTYNNDPVKITLMWTFQDATPNATIHYDINFSNGAVVWGEVSSGGTATYTYYLFPGQQSPSISGTMYATAPGYVQSASTSIYY